jgi:hypothetical protein
MAALVVMTAAVAAVPARSEPAGSVVQVSSVGPPGNVAFDADDPRVAFGADGRGLAVYLGEPVDGEQEVFGQTVDASGTPAGAQHRLTHVGPDGANVDEARDPDVVYNPHANEFLLVSSNAIGTDEDIAVQRVGLDGAPIGSSVPVSETGGVGPGSDGDNQRPRVAYNADRDEYLVVWIDGRDVAGNEVRAQRLNASTLAQVGAADFFVSDIASGNANAQRVDVDYGGGTYLVTWSDFTAGGDEEIIGRRVSSAGGVVGGEVPLSRQGGSDSDGLEADRPAVAYDAASNEFLAVWHGDLDNGVGSGESEIFGRRVSAGGVPVGSAVRISHQGPDGDLESDAEEPAIAADSDNGEYLVVWQGNGPAQEIEIYGQRLTAAGAEVGTDDARFSNQGPPGNPDFYADTSAVAYNPRGQQFLAVWRGTRSFNVGTADSEDEIFARPASTPIIIRDPTPSPSATPSPTATPTPTPTPAVPKPATPAKPRARDVIRFPSTRRCVSRRAFRIRLRRPNGLRLVSARVVLNGKRLRVVKGRRLTSAIVLRGLPKGRFKVKITVTTSTGQRLTGTRKYHTCTKKRRSKRPPRV